ncbi:Ribosome maturation factor RimM [Candidatus Arsenophonus lipoptenae]|uniref:Ribosome maturation factor RimM n=1 Tax=Candidatus Arsenophonus lipoptenae TaxID=634113 RepID=A0A0X9VMK2_9GAMM|nr:ribosome maturation factor RimM [Candidatus Arsenophonus lipoptenae]AMA64956.1 Ribosome maturation factor RimM [Candidatus Arsenophonus lipoptenae]
MLNKKNYLQTPINPIALGRLGSPYGILGWIRVYLYTEYIENIFKYQPLFVRYSYEWKLIELEKWKYHNKCIILKIKNINNRSSAILMTNFEIIIDSIQLPILNDKEYYWRDLIGCEVITIQGYYNLGYVKDLIDTGVNDVLIIQATINDAFHIKERLIPFIDKQVIKTINFTTNIIEVDWDPKF